MSLCVSCPLAQFYSQVLAETATPSPNRCRSFAIETKFTDEQVLSEDFLQTIKQAMEVAVPFVHLLNEVRLNPLSAFPRPRTRFRHATESRWKANY